MKCYSKGVETAKKQLPFFFQNVTDGFTSISISFVSHHNPYMFRPLNSLDFPYGYLVAEILSFFMINSDNFF